MILWKFDIFDRLVFKNWRIVRQHLFMNISGKITWRDVKLNGDMY